jgi:uncharacterized membrane protein YjjB (DUF3815 family)
MIALKIAAVFCMATSVGVLYRIPRSLLLYGSLTGVLGWLVMRGTVSAGGNLIMADFFGSVVVGLSAELLARLLRTPATIFIIPGFIPLVPGGEAYTTMVHLVSGQYNDGVAMGMKTILTGGAIAFGLFVSSTIYHLVINYHMENNVEHVDKN